ncbi:hypothetical protein D3C74_137630 [compost metagenome]
MTYDHELTLITPGQIIEDDIGNQIESDPIETIVYCGLKSISRAEYYNAASTGLNPEIVFLVHGYEYDGQETVKFNEAKYKIIRTYSVDFEELELVCEKVKHD